MMKKQVLVLMVSFFLSCDTNTADRNPYLPEVDFSFEINLNLPLYSSLKVPGNAIYIGNAGVGVKGIFVVNNGSSFFAWEASCPNHTPNDCSTMSITDGINCTCSCEAHTYSLIDGSLLNLVGEPETDGQVYSLLSYNTSFGGDVVMVSN
ncbi:MAG: hypothetical protein AAF934_06120 [Bacteroidota bacterium]